MIALLAPRFGGMEIFPLWPKAAHPAKRVIVRARLGIKTPAIMLSGLTLHNHDGSYTEAANAVLRDGMGMAFER